MSLFCPGVGARIFSNTTTPSARKARRSSRPPGKAFRSDALGTSACARMLLWPTRATLSSPGSAFTLRFRRGLQPLQGGGNFHRQQCSGGTVGPFLQQVLRFAIADPFQDRHGPYLTKLFRGKRSPPSPFENPVHASADFSGFCAFQGRFEVRDCLLIQSFQCLRCRLANGGLGAVEIGEQPLNPPGIERLHRLHPLGEVLDRVRRRRLEPPLGSERFAGFPGSQGVPHTFKRHGIRDARRSQVPGQHGGVRASRKELAPGAKVRVVTPSR